MVSLQNSANFNSNNKINSNNVSNDKRNLNSISEKRLNSDDKENNVLG